MHRFITHLAGSIAVAGALLVVGYTATAAEANKTPPKNELTAAQRSELAAKVPGARAEDIRSSPIPGVYEISLGTSIGYISADGRHLISGDLFEIATRTNLTDVRKAEMRRKLMASLKDEQMIVFSPPAPKHTITVFTDVDCAYCRKLHGEMTELNRLGIRVRYAAYPRTGPNTPSWAKMEQVWCAKDRKDAITHAKQGEDVKSAPCATPVAEQFALGEQVGVQGTPAIITDTGEYIGGYLPAAQLAARLSGKDK